MRFRHVVSALIAVGISAAAPRPAPADIVILNTGEPRYGLVKPAPGQPDYIVLITGGGESQIRVAPKEQSRVKEIIREPEAKGLCRIGDQMYERQLFAEAKTYYEKALKSDPTFEEAQTRLKAVNQELDRAATEERKDRMREVSDLLRAARTDAEKEEFDGAAGKLAQAEKLEPTEAQKDELLNIRIQMLVDWGMNRLNHTDKFGAAEKFEAVLALAPKHVRATDELIKLYLNDSTKTDRVVALLEAKHQDNEKDYQTTKALAEIAYREKQKDKAAALYQTLYDNTDMRGTDVAERLQKLLSDLRDDAASRGDFEKAVNMQKALGERFPDAADERLMDVYEFGLRYQRLKAKDEKGWIALANWAKGKEMNKQALSIFKQVLDMNPKNAEAAKGYEEYGRAAIEEAQLMLNGGEYTLARSLFQQVAKDYGQIKDLALIAEQGVQKCDIEILRQNRKNEEHAQDLVDQGDRHYQRAQAAETNMTFMTQESSFRPTMGNPRHEAIQSYGLAVTAYQEALRLAPNMPGGDSVRQKLSDSMQRRNRLEFPVDYGFSPINRNR